MEGREGWVDLMLCGRRPAGWAGEGGAAAAQEKKQHGPHMAGHREGVAQGVGGCSAGHGGAVAQGMGGV